ncbi:MAG: alcohol dehydrogenase [Promethearchaeia archaeon]|nr:MAG: alcohol dehydrogenase [Candidatus Lokiarchaeia archaeon]
MKAMQVTSPKPIEEHPLQMIEKEIPALESNDILVKVRACGVCHTDLHVTEGDLSLCKYPVIPGHEIVGIVEKRGEKATIHEIGSRVGVAWLYSTCNSCPYCQQGKENLCNHSKFTGCSIDGGFAEYIAVNESYAYQLPEKYSDLNAAPLLCAGLIGYRSLKLSELKHGQRLGLFGFGASAHIVLQIAQAWNCETYVFTRSRNHQEHARSLGATWVGTPHDSPPYLLNSAITFAPVGEIVPIALRNLDKGGILAINAVHLSDIPSLPYESLYYERTIRSVAHTTRSDALEFFKIAEEIDIQTEIKEYPLSKANQALEDLKNSRFSGAAVLRVSE